MRQLLPIHVIVWMACAGGVAAGSPAGDAWLARADADLPRVVDTTEPSAIPLRTGNLAMVLYLAGPTDARRKLASDAIRRSTAFWAAREQTREGLAAQYHITAAELALIGDLNGAREMLADAERPTRLPSNSKTASDSAAYSRAFALLVLGHPEQIGELPPDLGDELSLAQTLRDAGRDDLADKLITIADNGRDAKWFEQARWQELADAGMFTDAMAVATSTPNNSDVEVRIARMALRAGDRQFITPVRERLISAVRDSKDDRSTMSKMRLLLWLCVEANDRAGIDAIAAVYRDPINRYNSVVAADSTTAATESTLAKAYFDIGAIGEAKKHVALCADAMRRVCPTRKRATTSGSNP